MSADLTEFTDAFADLLLAEVNRQATLLPNGGVAYPASTGGVAVFNDELIEALRPSPAAESEVRS